MAEKGQIPPELESRAREVFTRALDELAGPTLLARRKELLPALMESCYIVVLREEGKMAPDRIAKLLGTTEGAVQSVYDAPTEHAEERVFYEMDPDATFDPHMDPDWSGMPLTGRRELEFLVGPLARFAHGILQRERVHPH